jgi:hypothetical protein
LNGSKVATSGNAFVFDGTNVGIGTASPDANFKLDVQAATGRIKLTSTTGTNSVVYQANNTGGTLNVGIDSSTGGSLFGVGAYAAGVWYSGNYPLVFGVNNAEGFRLTSSTLYTASGINVGIGTASPGAKLHVLGSNLVGIFAGTNANTVYTEYRYNSTTTSGFIGNGSSILSAAADSDFIVRSEGALKFATNGNNFRAVIDTSGNLGLGVTPSLWSTSYRAFEFGSGSLMGRSTNTDIYLLSNSYLNTSGNFVYKSSAAAGYYSQATGAHYWYRSTDVTPTAGNTISFTQAMTLDADGDLGVGITSPSYRFQAVRSGDGITAGISGGTYGIRFDNGGTFSSGASTIHGVDSTLVASYQQLNLNGSVLTFQTGASERARITAGGFSKFSNYGTYRGAGSPYHEFVSNSDNNSVIVLRSAATNTAQYGMAIETANDQADATRYFLSCLGNTTERATIRSNGGLANYSANDVNLASDERLKKDIAPLASTWGKVKDIEVVNFRYKDCGEDDPALYGVIAQQVQQIVPELVVVTREATETEPEYYGIREQPMYWLAIKALQEAMTRIEQLEAKVAALESK